MAKQQKVRFGPGIEGFARRGLNKRPVVAGDRIFIPGMTLFAEALPFAIVQTSPKGIVQVLPDTEIIIKEEPISGQERTGHNPFNIIRRYRRNRATTSKYKRNGRTTS